MSILFDGPEKLSPADHVMSGSFNAPTKQPPGPERPDSRGQAEILDEVQIQRVMAFIQSTKSAPEADKLKLLLSCRAGLRAGEIAAIGLDALLTADGRVSPTIEIRAKWTKTNRPRSIPMHPEIREAIRRFRLRFPEATHVAITVHKGRIRRQSAKTLCVYFQRLYADAGLKGCSSHSGRRTFITMLARRANAFHSSLRDVQILAGHVRLDSTERYIEPSKDVSSLVQSLGEDLA